MQGRKVKKSRKKYLWCKSRFLLVWGRKWRKERFENFLLFYQRSWVKNLQFLIIWFFRLDGWWGFFPPFIFPSFLLEFFSLSSSWKRSEGNNKEERKKMEITFWDQISKPKRKFNTFFSPKWKYLWKEKWQRFPQSLPT